MHVSVLEDKKNVGFPCHTQAVERCVKLVTEASEAVIGAENRDGWVRKTMLSRATIPRFETMADFKVVEITLNGPHRRLGGSVGPGGVRWASATSSW